MLYWFLFVTTTARLVDFIYLLAVRGTNLPFSVIVVTGAMILYGAFLLLKRLFGNVTLKQLMAFYLLQTGMILFNLAYVSITSPLRVSMPEIIAIGTFFDVLINCCVVYFCTKQLRSHYFAVAQPLSPSNRHG